LATADYLVLEADDRIGGYCKTTIRNGFVWDHAGHFFHFRKPETERWLRERMDDQRHRHRPEAREDLLWRALDRVPVPEEHPSASARRIH